MKKLNITRLSLAVACALPLAAGAQQGLTLKSQSALLVIPPSVREDVPLFIEADGLQGHQDRDTEAEGNVWFRKRGQAVYTDWLRYDKPAGEITAQGNVRMELGADLVEGTRLRYNLESDRGFMENSRYTLHKTSEPGAPPQLFREADARGTAERILFEGPGQYRAERTEYTTCGPGNDDWYLRAVDLRLDKERDVGVARDASIVFFGTPIFYSPYLSFPLHQERRSGFITPHYGSTNTGGAEFTIPYYWNIAPNRDATLSPRIMTRRGVQTSGEFRYLEPTYLGEARGEVLPDDRAKGGEQRRAYFLRHNQTLPAGWSGTLNVQRVSDDTYFTDLSTQIAVTSQVQLPSDLTLVRGGTWGGTGSYGLSALAQTWQTLQPDPLQPVTPQYNRLPQLTLTALRPEVLRSDFDFYGQYTTFEHPTFTNGTRVVAYPSLSLPLQTAYAAVTPKLGVNVARYFIEPNNAGSTDQSRTVPIFTTDSSVVFERPTTVGGAPFVQTLEPRLYYVYIPFRNQNAIPVFDSAQQDINFATIYSENQFSGWDRINDANQVTVGATSRFIATDTGAERLRVGVAQRFYFESQQVTLPGVAPRSGTSSDLLAALSGAVAPYWRAEAGLQYTTNSSELQKFNVGARYQPAPGRVVNLTYRYTNDSLRQTDFSTQWPVGRGWTGLARWNHSLLDNRTLEGLLGAEYQADCWGLRLVAHRFATTTQQTATTFFVQLELNGVSRIGTNPMEALRRNIGGYARLDPRSPRLDDARPSYY
ncbi:MAG: LPS-assembly protein LptD [Burkholderiales bacterium]